MTDAEFDSYLSGRYHKAVDWYDRKAQVNKGWFYALSVYLFVASAFLTAIGGLPDWKLAATIVAGGSSVAAALLGLIKCQENWLGYRSTWDALLREPALRTAGLYDYGVAGADRNAVFVRRVEELLSREDTQWLSRQQAKTGANKTVGSP